MDSVVGFSRKNYKAFFPDGERLFWASALGGHHPDPKSEGDLLPAWSVCQLVVALGKALFFVVRSGTSIRFCGICGCSPERADLYTNEHVVRLLIKTT